MPAAAAAAAAAADADDISSTLEGTERHIFDYHATQLAKWTAQQQAALQRAAELDHHSLEAQGRLSEGCLDGLTADLEDHAAAREEALLKSQEAIDAGEEEFTAQLYVLGDAQGAQIEEALGQCSTAMTESCAASLDGQWEILDGQLRAILWQHAKLLHGASASEGLAELFEEGELQPYLENERAGWADSQKQDLEALQKEIDRSYEEIFEAHAALLREHDAAAVLEKQRSAELEEMAAVDRERLKDLELEVRSTYEAEFTACLTHCEEDYCGYDVELQSILLRTMRSRIADAAHMRQLKLALCRWRLDYQKVYHDHCDMLGEPETTGMFAPPQPRSGAQNATSGAGGDGEDAEEEAEDAARMHLELLRQLVTDLWAKNRMPNSEIRLFLDRVEEAALRGGHQQGQQLAQVYQEELSQYGALPVLEHADRPELLDCWLQTLWDGGLPPGASKRPSIGGSSHGSIPMF